MNPSRTGHHPRASRVRDVFALVQALAAAAALAALLVGLPWALSHYLGWPLPHHVPTPSEAQEVLLGPLTAGLLLDILACLCWITWAAFVIDVARAVVDAARGTCWPDQRTHGPLHTTAAILVGVIVLSVLGTRTATAATAAAGPTGGGHQPVVATAPSTHPTEPPPLTNRAAAPGPRPADAAVGVVVVREPEHGIHDTLSRIAERSLKDPARWPEIFHLNHGHPQPHGHRLTNPNLIYPGERLLLPHDPPTPPAPRPAPAPDHQPLPAPAPPAPATAPLPTPTPSTSPPAAPTTAAPAPSLSSSDSGKPGSGAAPGVEWSEQVLVGAVLAAAISAAVVLARHRHRRAYQPGSGRRDDLPVAPVVYQLRLAHLRRHSAPDTDFETDLATATGIEVDPEPDSGSGDTGGEDSGDEETGDGADADPAPAPGAEVATAAVLGVRDGQEIALDLARGRGLGLAGPGAAAALRAVLVTLLAPTPAPPAGAGGAGGARVIVPADDLAALLGHPHRAEDCQPGLRVAADLDTALRELDTTITTRAHHPGRSWPVVVLVAQVPTHHTARLQAVLDNGAGLGVLGILLGQWRPGASAYVRADATVSATSPGPAQPLLGARLFHLPAPGTADLLALLHDAHPRTGEAVGGEDGAALEVTALPGPADPAPDPAAHTPPAPPARAVAEADARSQPGPPVTITVLGTPRVWWTPPTTGEAGGEARDITAGLAPRQRELLVFLALHPDGVSRDTLIARFWDDTTPARSTNAFNTALTRLRRALKTATDSAISDLVVTGDGQYRLDPHLTEVDYWRFADAVTARRDARTDTDRIAAYQRIVDTYHGPLADGIDTDWLHPVREATRRDALDAVAALARAHLDDDPHHTLDLLETARAFDPHNELLYRDIMRIQHRLGRLDAIPRTLALLTTRLAEIDEHPTPHAHQLATRLQHHPPQHTSPTHTGPHPEKRRR